jgi:hypothetical protein
MIRGGGAKGKEAEAERLALPGTSENALVAIKRSMNRIKDLVDEAAASQGKTEGCKLLEEVAKLVLWCNGGRITCCKSGKDRTSMSATLEQSRLLLREHFLPSRKQKEVLAAMRRCVAGAVGSGVHGRGERGGSECGG